jgi:hypothetical protein
MLAQSSGDKPDVYFEVTSADAAMAAVKRRPGVRSTTKDANAGVLILDEAIITRRGQPLIEAATLGIGGSIDCTTGKVVALRAKTTARIRATVLP